jgi:diacylglycerol kinase family enzyme
MSCPYLKNLNPMPPPFAHLHVIANPAAGTRKPVRATLSAVLDRCGVPWTLSVTSGPGEGRRLAEEAIASGADVIAVYGGDGTVADVASGLAGSTIPLAILPGGTANILAVELGLPRRLDDAVRLICDPDHTLRALDRGLVGERSFLIRASAGFEAAIIENTDPGFKHLFGPFGYGIGALRAVRPRFGVRFHLVLDGQPVDVSGFNVWIANAGSIGRLGLVFSPHIRPDDGLLDVIALNFAPSSLLALAASAVRWDAGARALRHWQAREVVIEADPPQPVHLDGEPVGHTPLTVTVQPGAVQVIVRGKG